MNPQSYPNQRRITRMSTPVLVGILLAVVTGLGVAGYYLFTAAQETLTTASQSANEFLTLMQMHDFKDANALLTSIGQDRTPVKSMKSIESLVEENHGAVTGWTRQRWFIQNNNGDQYVRLTYKLNCSRSNSLVEIVVERVGNIYQVYSFNYQI